jgi:4'-phosphopantetheinyl transferase
MVSPPEQKRHEDVELWRVDVPRETGSGSRLWTLLCAQERERCSRFVKAADRSRYLYTHAGLRQLLGWRLRSRPEDIRFETLPDGKPILAPIHDCADLRFNVSHSGTLALIAIGWQGPVGVDTERIRADLDMDGIAARYFPPDAAERIGRLEGDGKAEAFFLGWTALEAFHKAMGLGLRSLMHGFDVDEGKIPLVPDRPGPSWPLGDWCRAHPEMKTGYASAVVYGKGYGKVRIGSWDPDRIPI